MKAFDGAIFDMDGTLVDSMKVWLQVDKEFMSARGIPLAGDYVEAIGAMGLMEAAVYTKERYGLPEAPEDIVRQWKELCLTAYRSRVGLKPGARAYLDQLRKNGVKIALATSSPRVLADAALNRCGIYGHFDVLVTADDVAEGKESPEIYLRAAALLGLSAQSCCVFEDIYQGISSAKRAGMRAVGVYDESATQADWERITALADVAVPDFTCLLESELV